MNKNNNLLTAISLIRSDNFILINRDLIHAIGLEETTIFSELCSKYAYYLQQDKLEEDGSFYCTVDTLEIMTSITEKRQRKALNCLQELGILKVLLKGIPPKRFILLDENLPNIIAVLIKQGTENQRVLKDKLTQKAKLKAQATERARQEKSQFRQNGGFSSTETEELVPSKRQTINNNSISNKINNNKSLIGVTAPNQDATFPEKKDVETVIEENTISSPDNNSSKNTPSSPKVKKLITYTNEGFITFWDNYPRKVDKAKAYKAYLILLASGYTEIQLNTACKNYATECRVSRKAEKYIKYPSSFLEVEYLGKYLNPTTSSNSTTATATLSFEERLNAATSKRQSSSNRTCLGWDNFDC